VSRATFERSELESLILTSTVSKRVPTWKPLVVGFIYSSCCELSNQLSVSRMDRARRVQCLPLCNFLALMLLMKSCSLACRRVPSRQLALATLHKSPLCQPSDRGGLLEGMYMSNFLHLGNSISLYS